MAPGRGEPCVVEFADEQLATLRSFCGQSERRKSPGQPCFVRLPTPSVLNRITSACARAAIRLPVTSLCCSVPSGNTAQADDFEPAH